jgi:Uncharacterised nucleotidyltransferase
LLPLASESPIELLLLCARWPQRDADRRQIVELIARGQDWSKFVFLARHHRIVPLVSRNLHAAIREGVPVDLQEVLSELQRDAGLNAIRALRLLGEHQRVLKAFAADAITARVIKGLPLAKLVFGDIGLRAVGDLDLLIDESQILRADRLLGHLGYVGNFAPNLFSPNQLAHYQKHWKDLSYKNKSLGMDLDLHWRCFRNPEFPGATLCSESEGEIVRFGGLEIRTLCRSEMLLYLCIHGTLDGWIYFKTLVDVGAELRQISESQLDTIALLAVRHRVLPELSATCLLIRRHFGMDFWSARLLRESDRTVAHILRYTTDTLDRHAFEASREQIPISRTLLFEWGLRHGFRYRLELLSRILYRARMWQTLPLPDWLFWAYPLLSPVEWLLFRWRSRAREHRDDFPQSS